MFTGKSLGDCLRPEVHCSIKHTAQNVFSASEISSVYSPLTNEISAFFFYHGTVEKLPQMKKMHLAKFLKITWFLEINTKTSFFMLFNFFNKDISNKSNSLWRTFKK